MEYESDSIVRKRKRKRKLYGLTAFPPFSQKVKTNIGKLFFKMVLEDFTSG